MRNPPSIPYMGNKSGIAIPLINKILKLKPNAKYFYDVFGGGGSMSVASIMQTQIKQVFYAEKNIAVRNLMKFLTHNEIPSDWYDWVSRDKFFSIVNSDRCDAYAGYIQTCWSFGNNARCYLFGKDIEEFKRLGHKWVVNDDLNARDKIGYELGIDLSNKFLNESLFDDTIGSKRAKYTGLFSILKYDKKITQLERLEQLERLQQLQQLQQLQRLQQLQQLERLIVLDNDCYSQLNITTPLEETIIYCDPPYINTASYKANKEQGFNHYDFYEWFKNLPCSAFMSEYTAPFEKVFSIKKRSTLGKNKEVEENLYWNGK